MGLAGAFLRARRAMPLVIEARALGIFPFHCLLARLKLLTAFAGWDVSISVQGD